MPAAKYAEKPQSRPVVDCSGNDAKANAGGRVRDARKWVRAMVESPGTGNTADAGRQTEPYRPGSQGLEREARSVRRLARAAHLTSRDETPLRRRREHCRSARHGNRHHLE